MDKKKKHGIGFILGVLTILGIYGLVLAVPPLPGFLPTFSPNVDDIDLNYSLECVKISGGGRIYCPVGYILTGGGISCGGGGDEMDVMPRSSDNSIVSQCGGAGNTTQGICCKIST